jgi:hypothetical protein
MPPPLPYFKVNICPFPLPHFASIFFAYFWSFRWPNYIVTLPRYFSFRLPHLNIPTGPPSDELDKNISERSLFYFQVIETDTATSGLRWIFHMHSEFSRRPCVTMPSWSSPLKCKVSLLNTDKYTPAPRRGRRVYCFTSVRLSVRLSVRPSVRHSVLPSV